MAEASGLSALFWGILTFSLLVVVHEGGHFAAARAFGVKVHEFMVGLPGPALRFHGKKTTYGITAVPLGGYVRIAGMEPGPEDPRIEAALAAVTRAESMNAFELAEALGIEEHDAESLLVTLADWGAVEAMPDEDYTYRSLHPQAAADDPHTLYLAARSQTYRALSFPKRVVVLSAGVVLNLLTAILVFTVVLSVWGYYKETMVVDSVTAASAADKAGIRVGDEIVAFEGEPVTEWRSLVTQIQTHEPGDQVEVTYVRDGKRTTVVATLGAREGTDVALLGLAPGFEQVRPSVFQAFAESFGYIGLTFVAIAGFFNPETFQMSVSNSSSVIGASYIAAQAAETGPVDYAAIVALLSLSLGVINIVPIPPLDGGKVAIEVVERLRGRPLPRNLSLGISVTGALMLFALIGYLMYADVVRFIAG